jgi:hypothetical protein
MSPEDAYNELSYYTLSHPDPKFIHQHVVDALGAQEPSPMDKPIRLVFSLVGLHLYVERGFNGREVQLVHGQLGRRNQTWPAIAIPENRGAITIVSVLASSLAERDSMIHQWCRSVWDAYSAERETIVSLLQQHQITDLRSVQRASRQNK